MPRANRRSRDQRGEDHNSRKPAQVKPITGLEVLPGVPPARPKQKNHQKNSRYPFIAWDGEATTDAGYCLLAASTGDYVCEPNLGTEQMLDLILQVAEKNPKSFHVGFGFNYDVNQILRDVPWQKLIALYVYGACKWKQYRIRHMTRKIFAVSDGQRYARIDDVFAFFNCSYEAAIEKYKVATPEQQAEIKAGKKDRDKFQWEDIEQIKSYCFQELGTMVKLMGTVRKDVNDAGFFVGQWHGPGALASYALRQNAVKTYQRRTDPAILPACRIAYAGGWFERYKMGVHYGDIFTADINSAYAYALAQMPSLANGTWEHVSGDRARYWASRVRMGLFKIRWRLDSDHCAATQIGYPMPIITRDIRGICHPPIGETWVHAPEAKLVADPRHVNYEFLEGWIFHDDGTYPFSWVKEMYYQRQALQAAGNPAEKGLKWTLASLYGKSAQRTGWNQRDSTPPTWHQLEWAGAITSACRSMVFMAARRVAAATSGLGLVSIDTDSVTSTVPFDPRDVTAGTELGQWSVEHYSGIVFVQSGFYWLRKMDGTWEKPKTRGLARGSIGGPEDAIRILEAMPTDRNQPVELFVHNKRHFVGFGEALRRGNRDEWRTWVDSDFSTDPRISGNRIHSTVLCRCCSGGKTSFAAGLHDLATPNIQGFGEPHKLPWLEPDKCKALMDELRKLQERHDRKAAD